MIYALNSAMLTKNQEKEQINTFFFYCEISDPTPLKQPYL